MDDMDNKADTMKLGIVFVQCVVDIMANTLVFISEGSSTGAS